MPVVMDVAAFTIQNDFEANYTLVPEEAVAIYVARHPELKADLLLAQWKAAMPSLATTAAHQAGWQDAQSWQDLAAWMLQSGQVSKPVSPDGLVTNAYLPAP